MTKPQINTYTLFSVVSPQIICAKNTIQKHYSTTLYAATPPRISNKKKSSKISITHLLHHHLSNFTPTKTSSSPSVNSNSPSSYPNRNPSHYRCLLVLFPPTLFATVFTLILLFSPLPCKPSFLTNPPSLLSLSSEM